MKLIQLINRPIDNFYIVPQANGQFSLPIGRMTRTLVIYILTLPSNSKDNIKGAVSRNSATLGNYKMPVKLRET